MSIMQVLSILRARVILILLTVVVSVVSCAIVLKFLPKQYQATSTILLDISTPDAVTGRLMPGAMVRSYIRTQIKLIQSERVAQQVVKDLGLTNSTYFLNEFSKSGNRADDLEQWIGNRLLENLNVRVVGGSDIIAVSYVGTSPNIAAQLTNAFVDAYIAIDLDLRVEPARRNSQWFASQLNILRQNLDLAQERLTSFQQSRGILEVSDQVDAENSRLVDLTQRYTAALAEVSESKTVLSQLDAFGNVDDNAELPNFLVSGRLQQWRDELTRLDGTYTEQSERLGVNHPEIVSLVARREVIKKQIVEEYSKLKASVAAQLRISEEKAKILEQELSQQKATMLTLKGDRNQLELLRREVEIRKAEYDDAFRRAGTLRLEGNIGQSDLRVMEEAVAPLSHSFPKNKIALGLALGASFVLGVALAFLLEMIDRRIRSAKDLTQITEKPVFGALVSGKPAKRRKLLPGKQKSRSKVIPKSLPAAAE